MKTRSGFSLVELLISLIVAAILVLTAGSLSSISLTAYNKEMNKQGIYNDLSYGLKLLRNRFRNAEASSVSKNTAAGNVWVGQTLLEIENQAFGIYQLNNSSPREFVFLADKSNQNKREVLLSVPGSDFSWTVECDPSDCGASGPGPKAVTVKFDGTKNKYPFHMETTVTRRNP